MFVVLLIVSVLQATTPGGIDKRSAGNILLGLSMIALVGADVIAIGLGIAGILQRERKKLFAILGTILAFATVAGTMFLVVIGLALGRTSKADATKDPDLIKGAQALLRKDGSTAVEAFTNASRKFPRNDAIFLWLGRGYGMLRDNDNARQNYERAVELNPKNADAWMYLGMSLNEKEPSKAIEACKKATELQPANASVWFILGLTYVSQKNFSLAVPALERAVQIKPDFAEAWSTLADTYSVTGDYKRSSDARQRTEDLKARSASSLRNDDQPTQSRSP